MQYLSSRHHAFTIKVLNWGFPLHHKDPASIFYLKVWNDDCKPLLSLNGNMTIQLSYGLWIPITSFSSIQLKICFFFFIGKIFCAEGRVSSRLLVMLISTFFKLWEIRLFNFSNNIKSSLLYTPIVPLYRP